MKPNIIYNKYIPIKLKNRKRMTAWGMRHLLSRELFMDYLLMLFKLHLGILQNRETSYVYLDMYETYPLGYFENYKTKNTQNVTVCGKLLYLKCSSTRDTLLFSGLLDWAIFIFSNSLAPSLFLCYIDFGISVKQEL